MNSQSGAHLTNEDRPRVRDEDGFSLIELLIVIVILPVVVGGIAAALLGILQNEAVTFNKVSNSADAQITSANFTRDVQSALSVTTGNPTTPGDCGWTDVGLVQPTGASELLSLTWGQYTNAPDPNAILTAGSNTIIIPQSSPTLFTEADVGDFVNDFNGYFPGSGMRIVSWQSPTTVTVSAPASTTTSSGDTIHIFTLASVISYWDVPVASGSGATYDLMRRFCTQGGVLTFGSSEVVAHNLPANQSPATVNCISVCNLSGWVPTTNVSNVTLSDNEQGANTGQGYGNGQAYEFDLSASPRYDSASVLPSLLIMNGGLSLPSATDKLGVDGTIAFNLSSGGVSGPLGAQLSATTGFTANQCTPNAQQNCPSITASFNGTLTCNVSPCPATPTSSATLVPAVTAPTMPSSPGSCGTTCQPGAYPSTPLVVTGPTSFTPGTFYFPGPVTFAQGSTVSLGTGQYVFAAGLTIQPGSTVVGNGVFFDFPASSSLSLNVTSTTSLPTSVQLTPLLTGPYAGILVYQSPSDGTTMLLGASNASTNDYGGEVEAPGATIILGTANDNFTVGAIVAKSVTLGTSVTATVGP